jgi:signal transduction histidine kinase/DNA-binding response OmpR family regulator
MIHSLLKRQLKRIGILDEATPPSAEAWQQFLERVSRAYVEADQERYLLERSLAISSRETQELYENLRQSSESRIAVLYAAVQQELAERKRAEQALLQQNEHLAALHETTLGLKNRAEAANRAKSTFLANMSHELRTPLSAIIGYSELLQIEARFRGNDDLVSDLEKIHGAGRHLLNLITNILDLSKIEAGKMELHLETFPISALIEGVVTTIRPLVERNTNTLEVHWADDLGTMHADLTKVRQALFNLLSNAAKFTQQGRIVLTVARERADDADWISFRVADTGVGMTQEQLQNLFQEFTQADPSITSKYGGTGLGLALSRRFCQMMGGDITVSSAVASGSTFVIRLPAAVDQPPAAPAEEITLGGQSQARPPLRAGASTVLVIDDDAAAREMMTRYLAKEEFCVETAASGEEGLRRARELRPHAITLDVLMPGMDGWEVLIALKADPNLADIPVIMLTFEDQQDLGSVLGAADYLVKPIDSQRLIATLSKYQYEGGAAERWPRGQILIVEDDAALRAMFRRVLEGAGWMVAEAETGRAALAQVAASSPDLILLDLLLPELDGLEVINELQATPGGRAIPIVVVTAKELTHAERIRLNSSVAQILQKGSCQLDVLLHQVHQLVMTHIRHQHAQQQEALHG